jgi:hypothetical protein
MLMVSTYWAEAYILYKITEYIVVASKEIRLEVNADKTKYLVMSRDQNAGQNHNIKLMLNPWKAWNISNIWEQP